MTVWNLVGRWSRRRAFDVGVRVVGWKGGPYDLVYDVDVVFHVQLHGGIAVVVVF